MSNKAVRGENHVTWWNMLIIIISRGQIKWPTGAIADYGKSYYTVRDINSFPRFCWHANPKKNHTIYCGDVDPLGHNECWLSQTNYLTIVNIPGNDTARGLKLFDLLPITPTWNSGAHRFICVVYEQPGGYVNFSDDYPKPIKAG